MAALDKISPTDPRIARSSAEINGKTYGFLCAIPEGGFDRTIILNGMALGGGLNNIFFNTQIHGFPDLSFGWRYQIPLFLDLGYRVVCPDCIGYGRSVSFMAKEMLKQEPWRHSLQMHVGKDAPTDSIIPYTLKSLADDFVSLAKQLGCANIIVGGHDWGAMIAYRMAIWHPEFVTHIFTACVPHILPNVEWVEIESLTKIYPTLGYQLQFGSGLIEQETRTKEGIHKFLNAMYDGRTSDNQSAMDPYKGWDFGLAARLEKTAFLSEEELEYYVNEFSRNGLDAACNYYRNHRQNFLDDSYFARQENSDAATIKCPTLFLCATEDIYVTSEMTEAMKKSVSNLTFKEVNATHWILWEKPGVVNGVLREWFRQQGLVINKGP